MLPINQILIGDCREVMAGFPAESVGVILTSPPYNVGLKYDGFDDNLPEDEFRKFNLEWLEQAYRVAMDTARLYVVVHSEMFWWFRPMAEQIGWHWGQMLTWCKPNFVSPSRISQDWNNMAEYILLFRKGKRTPMLNSNGIATTHNWFVEATPQSNFKKDRRIHPAQMPLKLCKKILSRTPGEPILDPFTGSGNVLKAAKALGRAFVGVELVPQVAEKARVLVGQPNTRLHLTAGTLHQNELFTETSNPVSTALPPSGR